MTCFFAPGFLLLHVSILNACSPRRLGSLLAHSAFTLFYRLAHFFLPRLLARNLYTQEGVYMLIDFDEDTPPHLPKGDPL